MPPFVALTGGIGAGKSTALAALERLGASVISSDAVVHELYGSTTVRDAVRERFGPDVLQRIAVPALELYTRGLYTDDTPLKSSQDAWAAAGPQHKED